MFINESVVGFIVLFLFLSLFHLSLLWTLLFPSFYQLGLCFTFPSSLICNVRYLFFEVSLVSWSRPISIYISLLELLSRSPYFGLLYFHFSSVSMCFLISSLSSLLNNPLVIQNSEGPFLTVLIIQISYINSLGLHFGKKVFILPSFLEDPFSTHQIRGWQLFAQYFQDVDQPSSHVLWSEKKSAFILIFLFTYVYFSSGCL